MELTPEEQIKYNALKRKGILTDAEIKQYNNLRVKDTLEYNVMDEPSPIPKVLQITIYPNPCPDMDYTEQFVFENFMTFVVNQNQKCFGKISIEYIPGDSCIDLHSLKAYLIKYQEKQVDSIQLLCSVILQDCLACFPRQIRLIFNANFNQMDSTIIMDYQKPKTEGTV
jgi:7-cyano-7-deazaguanine reductase